MVWQENLISNLLVFFILGSLFILLYCKMSNKTLTELIQDIRGGMSNE